MRKDVSLRTTFDSEAQLYHAARPGYPESLFDALVEQTRIGKASRLLEVGPGTGQATLPMAQRGFNITAVELGPHMANVARDTVKECKNAQIHTGAFEETDFPPATFDLIYAATSFHWVKPEVRFKKSHQLLKDNGHLALIFREDVFNDEGNLFFEASQPIYDKYTPQIGESKFHIKHIDSITPPESDLTLFDLVSFRPYPIELRYSAEKYTSLLATYSATMAMDPDNRKKFLDAIGNLINEKFNGEITRHFAMTLTILRKKSA